MNHWYYCKYAKRESHRTCALQCLNNCPYGMDATDCHIFNFNVSDEELEESVDHLTSREPSPSRRNAC